ncbi:MAG: hypothetical protein R6V19_12395 [Armatimonadota bacterium]
MKNWRFVLFLAFLSVTLCASSLAQSALPQWIEQIDPADYALLEKDLPDGLSMRGDILVEAHAAGSAIADPEGNVRQADWAMVGLHQEITIAVEGLRPGLTPPSVSIHVNIPETPEQALALARQLDYNWQRGLLLNPDPWDTANDLQDPQIAVHGGSRISPQKAIIWYRNVFAKFNYLGSVTPSSWSVTEERLRRVALLWFNKVSRLTPPELADLRIEPDGIQLVQRNNTESLPFEMAADQQSVGFKVQNASTTTAARNVHAQLLIAHRGDEQARPVGDPISVGTLQPEETRWMTTVWDLKGENVHNGLVYVQVYTPDAEDANPDDNIAGLQVNIYYAHNGQRAFSWFDDTYSFENFTFDDRETEAMVEGIIATIVGNLSADQNTTGVLERIFFPQTYMRIRDYLNTSAREGAGGHCYGMSATVALYFEDASLKPVAKPMPAMTRPEASANIAVYHRAQMLPVLQGALADGFFAERDFSVNATRAAIVQSLRDERQSSIIEFFGAPTGSWQGHAVLAYKIIEIEGRDPYVYVYDSNFPTSTVPPAPVMSRIKLNADGSNWANPGYMGYGWANAQDISARRPHRTISLAEINAIVPELKKAVQEMTSFMDGANRMMAVLRCPAEVVFTDAQGRRTGVVNGRAINEIPGAEIRTEGEVEIYMLPSDGQYSVSITGTDLGEASFDIIRAESATKAGLTSFQEIPTAQGETAAGTLLPGGQMQSISARGRDIAPRINGTYEDGRVTRQSTPTPAPAPAPTPGPPTPLDALLGEWSVVMAMLDGPQPTTLSIKRDGDGVVGTLDDRINAYLRLKSEWGGTTYVGTWTDPQAGTVSVRATITGHGALIVTLGTGGDDLLFNAVRPFGGAGTGPTTSAPTATPAPTPGPAPTPRAVPDLSGDWRINANNSYSTLTLQHEGNRLTGSVYGRPIAEGQVLADGTVSFIRTGVNQTYTGTFSVEPDGTWKLSGTFDCPVTRTTGSLWVAKRDPSGAPVPSPKLPERQTGPEKPASDTPGDVGGLQVGTGTEGGTITGVAEYFPQTNRVAAVLKYRNQQPGSPAVAVWTRDGVEVARREATLGGANGWLSFSLATQSPGGLRPGRYTLTITVGNTILGRKTFTIGGGVG